MIEQSYNERLSVMFELGDRVQVTCGPNAGQYGRITGIFRPYDDYTVALPGGACQYRGFMLVWAENPRTAP